MENKEIFDVILEKLRQHQPQLQNAKGLTETILHEIKARHRKKVPRILSFMQIFSGVTAVLLGVLFVAQFNHEQKENVSVSLSDKYAKSTLSPCLEMLDENKSNFREVYVCYFQQNMEKKREWNSLKNKFN